MLSVDTVEGSKRLVLEVRRRDLEGYACNFDVYLNGSSYGRIFLLDGEGELWSAITHSWGLQGVFAAFETSALPGEPAAVEELLRYFSGWVEQGAPAAEDVIPLRAEAQAKSLGLPAHVLPGLRSILGRLGATLTQPEMAALGFLVVGQISDLPI